MLCALDASSIDDNILKSYQLVHPPMISANKLFLNFIYYHHTYIHNINNSIFTIIIIK